MSEPVSGRADVVLVEGDSPGGTNREDERRVEFALCKGCQRDGHTGNHRNALGHPNKGHTPNGAGKARGTRNDSTIQAQLLRREHAKTAMNVLVKQLDDENPYIRFAAAKALLGPMPELKERELPDTEWMEYATDEELDALIATMERCKARMAAEDARPRDAFLALPAPEAPEPDPAPATPTEEDDDWTEI